MVRAIDFQTINQSALGRLLDLAMHLLPDGKQVGQEYVCGDRSGGAGDSLKVNLQSGRWADFASPGEKGGDPVSLWAAVHGVSQVDAARGLAGWLGLDFAKSGSQQHPIATPLKPDRSCDSPGGHGEAEKPSYPWKKAKRDDEPIKKYLSTRAISIDDCPKALKWGQYTDKETGQEVFQIVCAASKPTDEKVYAVQRLFVDPMTWKKTGAKMLGQVSGRGIWFNRKGDHSTVVVGEGVETCLSFHVATGGIFSPVAALSAGNMPALELPEETQHIYILVDSDLVTKGMAGQHAAYTTVQQFEASRHDRKAWLVTPDDSCFTENPAKLDFNDLLQADPSGESICSRLEKAIPFEKLQWRPMTSDHASGLTKGREPTKIDPRQALEKFVVKREYTEKLGKEEFLIDNLLISQHILVVVAMSGGGKTAFFFRYVAPLLADRGSTVVYLDNDSPTSDHPAMRGIAERHGFSFLNPDANVGTSVEELKQTLFEIANADSDLSRWVFIFDTLKKFTDMMSKNEIKEFFKLARKLTARGATVVLLAHANKYRSPEGFLVPEGTGDVRSDTDDLIIFERAKNANGGIDITTVVDPDRNAKVRGIFKPFSFHISPEREISFYKFPLAVTDPTQTAAPKATDEEILDAATCFLEDMKEPVAQQALVSRVCDLTGAGQKRVRALVVQNSERGDNPVKEGRRFWFTVGLNNRFTYSLPEVERQPEQAAMFDVTQFGKHDLGFGSEF